MNVALLIDAENIRSDSACELMSFTKSLGSVVCKRIYADFSLSSIVSWKEHILKLNLEPIHTYHVVKGKNAADIALCIDAMELALTGNIDIFVIASSDSDFFALVLKLDRLCKKVIIAGYSKTHELLQKSCAGFVNLDLPLTKDNIVCKDDNILSFINEADSKAIADDKNKSKKASALKIKPEPLSKDSVIKIINAALKNAQGQAILASQLCQMIRDVYPGFKSKKLGYKTFSLMVLDLGYIFQDNKVLKFE